MGLPPLIGADAGKIRRISPFFARGGTLRTAPSLQKGNLLAFSPRQNGVGKIRRTGLVRIKNKR